MTKSSTQDPWSPFLPRRAIIMVRRPISSASNATVVSTGTPLKTIDTPHELQQTLASPDTLDSIVLDLKTCTRCKLCQGRQTIVTGEGHPRASLMLIGEAPGEQEDIQGRPFVGKAGQLLDRMIQAIGLQRERVFITNVVKCRPPGNRNPEPDEIAACSPFLLQQIQVVQPKIILALGKFAAQTLLQTPIGITQLRGQFHPYKTIEGIQIMPTFHPSYLLRNPAAKREVWSDLQQVAKVLGLTLPRH